MRHLALVLQLLVAAVQVANGETDLASETPASPSERVPPIEELDNNGNNGNHTDNEAELVAAVNASNGQLEQQVLDLDAIQAAREGYFRHSAAVSVILTVAYTIVFVVGIVGNSFVVAIVCKSPRMRTVTNFFIANLAFADILVLLFCLPATLVGNLFIPYVLGLFVCKTVSYLQGVAVSASINTMVAVTIDRFLAICFPMDWHMSRRTARWTIASIWLFSLTISLPWAVFFTLQPYSLDQRTIHVCAEAWPSERWGTSYFVVANLILLYLFPLVAITVCYLGIWYKIERRHIPGERSRGLKIELIMQRSKLKVVKMMMVVVIIFLLSWLPLYLIFARIKLAEERSPWEEALITKMMPLAQWLGASNSCINPILYTFFNRKYKRGFVDLLRYGLCCGPKREADAGQHLEAGCVGEGANGSAGCPTSSHNQSNQANNNNNSNNFSGNSLGAKRNGGQLKMDTLRHHRTQQQELRHNKQMRMQSMAPASSVALKSLEGGAGSAAKRGTSRLGQQPEASPRASPQPDRKGSSGKPMATNGHQPNELDGLERNKLKFAAGGPPAPRRPATGKQQRHRHRQNQDFQTEQTNHKRTNKAWSSTPGSLNLSTSSRRSANKSTQLAPKKSLGDAGSQAAPGDGASTSAGAGADDSSRPRSLVWGRRKGGCKSLGSKSNSNSTSTSTNTTRDTELTDVTALSSAARLADLDEPSSISMGDVSCRQGTSATSSEVDIEEPCAYIDDDDDDDVDVNDTDETSGEEEADEPKKANLPTEPAPDDIPAKQHLIASKHSDYTVVRCPISVATHST